MNVLSWATAARWVAAGVVAVGTVVCGLGLLDLVVRPGIIERVDTLALVGVAGLILLPPLTLTMTWVERRRRRTDVPTRSEASAETARAKARAASGLPAPSVVRTHRVAPADPVVRTAPVSRPDAAPRRAAGGQLMSSVAQELSSAALVEERALRAEASRRSRAMQHDGHRRDVVRRRASQEMVAVVRAAREDLSDSMAGVAFTAG